jgi:hypothetical protein
MQRPHGRLSPGYVDEVLRLENSGPDDHAPAKVSLQPPAAPAAVHGHLTNGYVRAVADFLANAHG